MENRQSLDAKDLLTLLTELIKNAGESENAVAFVAGANWGVEYILTKLQNKEWVIKEKGE